MKLNKYTEAQQSNFSSFCKNGVLNPIDGLTPGRIKHYKRLISGVMDDNLRSAFPLTENLLKNDEWDNLVNDFVANHNSQTPIIWQMPFEFLEFINSSRLDVKIKYPHLTDLLLFEWKEIEIYMMEDLNTDMEGLLPTFNETSRIIINNEYDILQLKYPVHQKSAKEILKEDAGSYFVLIYRFNDKVRFFDISAMLAWFIKQIDDKNYSAKQFLELTSKLNLEVASDIIKANIKTFIQAMHGKGFVLGFINKEGTND